ncbi:hypothetical protein [Desulfonatronum thiosulfatophilum]|uniref:hypothetical protein n=1 Tax=Desulfonatronum thiosulfatophilum TaxID=617002 RepID=UPI0011143001|nr:hypothetical protein [Desulfonatronum thiosulfatophilum]
MEKKATGHRDNLLLPCRTRIDNTAHPPRSGGNGGDAAECALLKKENVARGPIEKDAFHPKSKEIYIRNHKYIPVACTQNLK